MDFFVFGFDLTVLDRVVVDHQVPGQQQHLLLTQKADTKYVGLGQRVTLHEFELLQVDIEQHQLVLCLDQEGHLATVVEEAVIADVKRLDDEWKVLNFGLSEGGSACLLVEFEFIADEGVGACDQDCRVEHGENNDLEGSFADGELGCEDASDLSEEAGFGRAYGWEL